MVFNAFDEESACWSYREGVLSMKVTRKGAVINTLEANWLDLTTFYYKQGLSLVDAFVSWETPKGELYLSNTSVCKSSGCVSKTAENVVFQVLWAMRMVITDYDFLIIELQYST